jgi:putative aldouronate transport system substrate-binding protein
MEGKIMYLKRSKSILHLLLVALLVIGLITGCTVKEVEKESGEKPSSSVEKEDALSYLNKEGFPIVKEKITIRGMGSIPPYSRPWDELDTLKKMEEITGIHFEWDTILDSAYNERKNLALASGDLPDLFLGGSMSVQDQDTYGPLGIFLSLEDYIEEYGSHIKKRFEERPDIKNATTSLDGHIYSLPAIYDTATMAGNLIYMNMDWLSNVGMEKPETTDDLYKVLKAFKTGDPNKNNKADEIPLSHWKQNPSSSGSIPGIFFGTILNAFTGMAGGAYFDLDGDKVIYQPIQPAFKEFLAYMNKLYEEELLEHEMFTQTREQYVSKVKEGKSGTVTCSITLVWQEDDDMPYEVLAPLTSSLNSKKVTALPSGVDAGQFTLTNKCKYPEALIRWVDIYFRTIDEQYEGMCGLSSWLGIYKKHWDFEDETRERYKLLAPSLDSEGLEYIVPSGAGQGWIVTKAYDATHKGNMMKAKESIKHYFPYTIQVYPSTARFTQEEIDEIAIIRADVSTYAETAVTKFITGDESLDNWDSYINSLKSMGLDDLTKVMQAAYDRWKQ